jgi:S-adenosylmethionine uptake transporter
MKVLDRPAAFGVASFGIMLFSLMDVLMKGLSLEIGAYNAILWRSLAGVCFGALLFARRPAGRPSREGLYFHIVRGILGAVTAFLFFWGLMFVPLAQGIALSFIAPIIALILAALLLKEQVSRATIWASILAFAGVSTILGGQAQSDMGPDALIGALAILASAVGYAWNLILMRQQSQVAGPVEVVFFQNVVMAGCLLLAAPFFAHLPALVHAPALVGAAVLATVSLMLLSWAYTHAEANFLAPVEFTAFVWAALFGWIAFDETVEPLTVVGAGMIVTACLWSARQRALPHVETTAI